MEKKRKEEMMYAGLVKEMKRVAMSRMRMNAETNVELANRLVHVTDVLRYDTHTHAHTHTRAHSNRNINIHKEREEENERESFDFGKDEK